MQTKDDDWRSILLAAPPQQLEHREPVEWLDARERQDFARALDCIGVLPTDQPALARVRVGAILTIIRLLLELASRYGSSQNVIVPLAAAKHRLDLARRELGMT